MTNRASKSPFLPPRWVVRAAWAIHRAIYSMTGGRRGLRSPTADSWGMMRLRTVGRRTGEERKAILGYFEDGPDLVTMAMNGWAEAEPAWWLNLQARPDTTVELMDGPRPSTPVQRIPMSGRACGPDGPPTTRASTATRPGGPARPRSSSCRPGTTEGGNSAPIGQGLTDGAACITITS